MSVRPSQSNPRFDWRTANQTSATARSFSIVVFFCFFFSSYQSDRRPDSQVGTYLALNSSKKESGHLILLRSHRIASPIHPPMMHNPHPSDPVRPSVRPSHPTLSGMPKEKHCAARAISPPLPTDTSSSHASLHTSPRQRTGRQADRQPNPIRFVQPRDLQSNAAAPLAPSRYRDLRLEEGKRVGMCVGVQQCSAACLRHEHQPIRPGKMRCATLQASERAERKGKKGAAARSWDVGLAERQRR